MSMPRRRVGRDVGAVRRRQEAVQGRPSPSTRGRWSRSTAGLQAPARVAWSAASRAGSIQPASIGRPSAS